MFYSLRAKNFDGKVIAVDGTKGQSAKQQEE